MRPLTPKQERFVDEYLIDLNATQAAIRAGYSAKTAEWIGPQLLGKSHVMASIQQAKEARSKETQIDAAWVLKRLADQANADLSDLYTTAGGLKPIHEWPDAWRKGLVAGVEVFEEFAPDGEGGRQVIGHTKKIKLVDRIKNLELIGKHVGVQAFREKLELTGRNDGPVQVDVTGMSSGAIAELLEAVKRAPK